MDVHEVFIIKFFAIDALATGAVTSSEVSALQHELRDHAMKNASFIVKGDAGIGLSGFARTQLTKIIGCLGNIVPKQPHHDSANRLFIDGDVKKDFVSDLAFAGDLADAFW